MAPFSMRREEKDDDRELWNHTSCPELYLFTFRLSLLYVRVPHGIMPVYVSFLLHYGLL